MVTTIWEFALFGGLRVRCGERIETRFRTQKTAALLTYLSLFPNRVHPREELAVRFWSEDGDDEGRRSLRVSLSSLRRQLETPTASEGELIVADRTSIGLRREAFVTDVFYFEEALTKAARLARTKPENYDERLALLDQAVTLYSAPLLPGFYEDWVLDERERLHTRFLDALREAERLCRLLGRAAQAEILAQRYEQSESSDKVSGSGVIPIVLDKDSATSFPDSSLPPKVNASHLPQFFTRFFGRERELVQLTTLLDDPSVTVITLLGPGGIGKTRLSVEAVRAWGESIVYAPLATVVRGEEVLDVLRDALNLPPAAGTQVNDWDLVTAHLRERAAAGTLPLLVLDNFEQVEDESGAQLLVRLMRAVPGVRFLVSSRRRLAVPGEQLFSVDTLTLPEEGVTDPMTLRSNPVVLFFADRARAVTPDFAVTARNAEAVARLCRLLDGLPLAIELAAAWASAFTPGQMAQKLAAQGERSTLLASRKTADRVDRHRSLWNAIRWSYDLLSKDMQVLWRRLSAFQGGFTPTMARTVGEDVFSNDGLARLRERSLLRLMEEKEGDDPDEPRYELLESLREFAGECVTEEDTPEEQAALRVRHAEALQQIIAASEADGYSSNYNAFTLRYKRELPNIRKVLNDSQAGLLPTAIGLDIAVGVGRLWKTGYLQEGFGYLSALLRRADSAEEVLPRLLRAKVLADISRHLRFRGESAASEARLVEAVELYRAEGDIGSVARSLASLGDVAQMQNDFPKARRYLAESLLLARESKNFAAIATSLHNLGNLAYLEDDYTTMQQLAEEELVIRHEMGEEGGIAQALTNIAIAARERGDLLLSEMNALEAIDLFHRIGDFYSVATGFLLYAELMIATHEWERAGVAYGVGAARNEEQGVVLSPSTIEYLETCQKKCRDVLGNKAFRQAVEDGFRMPRENMMVFLRRL